MIIQYIRLSSMIADQGLSSLSITPLSLMDVNSRHSCINLREKTIVLAHSCCHTLTPLLHLSNLQRHWKQTGVQQECGCLLGTARVCQISGTRSGSPHSLAPPQRKIGHSSHQPAGHPLHPAVPQVHSKKNHTAHPTAGTLK